MSWTTIVVMAAAAYGVKAFGLGPLARRSESPQGVTESTYVSRVVGLLPAALFSGLVVTQSLAEASADIVATRVVAVAIGTAVAVRTRSLTATILTAAVVAAVIRGLT